MRLDDGEVLVEQHLHAGTALAHVDAAALMAGTIARGALDAGHAIELQAMDPAGDIFPAGEWVGLVVTEPS